MSFDPLPYLPRVLLNSLTLARLHACTLARLHACTLTGHKKDAIILVDTRAPYKTPHCRLHAATHAKKRAQAPVSSHWKCFVLMAMAKAEASARTGARQAGITASV